MITSLTPTITLLTTIILDAPGSFTADQGYGLARGQSVHAVAMDWSLARKGVWVVARRRGMRETTTWSLMAQATVATCVVGVREWAANRHDPTARRQSEMTHGLIHRQDQRQNDVCGQSATACNRNRCDDDEPQRSVCNCRAVERRPPGTVAQ